MDKEYNFLISSQAELDNLVNLKYFNFNEMKCKSNPDFKCCDKLLISDNAIKFFKLLDDFRTAVGTPLFMTNLYRCENKNAFVGGEKGSAHMESIAADLYSNVMRPEMLYSRAYVFGQFKGMGVYLDYGFVHVDIKDRYAFWLNCKETNYKNEYFQTFEKCNAETLRIVEQRRKKH